MTVASDQLFTLDNTFVRELAGLYEPWQAAPSSAPELLVLNAPLAAELGLDADRTRHRRGRRAARRQRHCRPVRRRSRWPTPATSSAASHRASATVGRCCSANSSTTPGARRDLHLKGSGADAVRPRRRRQGRRRPDAARVRDQRGDARPRHPDDPVARRRRHRRRGRPRDDAARRGARPRRREPPAGRHVPVRRRPTTTPACCSGSPTTRSPATTRTSADAPNPYLAFFEAVVDAQAVARSPGG